MRRMLFVSTLMLIATPALASRTPISNGLYDPAAQPSYPPEVTYGSTRRYRHRHVRHAHRYPVHGARNHAVEREVVHRRHTTVQNKAEFVVLATIAGVNIKDLDIALEKDMMVIKGNRINPHTHDENKYFSQIYI